MKSIDYYMSPGSPWTYLGHERFAQLAKRHGLAVSVKPVDFGVIFPQSGGLPLPKRAPQRQAYRLVELRRWKEHLGVPLVIQPRHFPLEALWKDDRNIADPALLEEIGARHGVRAGDRTKYEANTQEALARGVFGAPSYVYRDEIFWGQDRLEFLERALAK